MFALARALANSGSGQESRSGFLDIAQILTQHVFKIQKSRGVE